MSRFSDNFMGVASALADVFGEDVVFTAPDGRRFEVCAELSESSGTVRSNLRIDELTFAVPRDYLPERPGDGWTLARAAAPAVLFRVHGEYSESEGSHWTGAARRETRRARGSAGQFPRVEGGGL